MSEILRLEAGRLAIFDRDGVFQARVRLGPNQYLYRSLDTSHRATAITAARRLLHSIEFRQQDGWSAREHIFSSVLDEYVELRERQTVQGNTSIYMLRQVKRVSKFWHEYIGTRDICSVGDTDLRGYIEWRMDYYSRREKLPKNARLFPTDKTLQWEIMLGKAIIKFAHEKGYRGTQPLPRFSFTPKLKRVRPAFEIWEYRRLLRTLHRWQRNCSNENWRQSRILLRDYVVVLANSGMRVGEANNLRVRDVEAFRDDLGRRNYRFKVKGKTGERDVIARASIAKRIDRLLERRGRANLDSWLFAMPGETKIITLIDQFNKVLELGSITRNSYGDKYTLYSLRHFYAVMALRRGLGVFEVARNMGTSVQVIQTYYGKHATPIMMATQLGR